MCFATSLRCVFLENVVFDAVDPRTLGRSWEAALGTETLTDEPEGFETRLSVPGGPVLDLCFQRVPEPPPEPQRLHLDLAPDAERAGSTRRSLAALRLEVADPERERDFWQWLTGWVPAEGSGTPSLQHPSHRGPLLELCPETAPKGTVKNGIHLDVRLEPGDDVDALAREIAERGGRELHFDWGDLPWRHFADPSGNELCLLPSRS
jgi:predicted enzyme related to lactoylglutathione lyase